MTIKTCNSKKTDRGIWSDWYFSLSPLKLTENDKLYFNCWNENKTVLEFTVELILSEREWLNIIQNVSLNSLYDGKIKVNIRKEFKKGDITINFGSKFNEWVPLRAQQVT